MLNRSLEANIKTLTKIKLTSVKHMIPRKKSITHKEIMNAVRLFLNWNSGKLSISDVTNPSTTQNYHSNQNTSLYVVMLARLSMRV